MQPNPVKTVFDAVRSETWRQRFLERLSRLDGFDAFLAGARAAHGAYAFDVSRALRAQAEQLIKSFPRRELASAKQYYNNALLVQFWRWFSQELDKHCAGGEIRREFPVFSVRLDPENPAYTVSAMSPADFGHAGPGNTADRSRGDGPEADDAGDPELHGRDVTVMARAALERLTKKLITLHGTVHQSFKSLFWYFLEINRRTGNVIWDHYRVYQFLDGFLYTAPNGQICRAPFDRIFFNSSLYELKLFLEHHVARESRPSLSDVEDFLQRQRRYYLRQAVSISLEESEALNHRKDLLAYDECQGVVVLKAITEQIRNHYRERKIKPYGLVKLEGCPFAQSRGVRNNALLEVYEHFDRIVLHFLAHSAEFDCLFLRRKHETPE